MPRFILICSFVLIFVQLSHQQATAGKEAAVIKTTLGRIRGTVLTSRKGRDIYTYRGIYYAKAPTGERRFAAPEPIEPWNNTLDALADGPSCPQHKPSLLMDENCLSLNVYSANVTASNPVIVFLHGGANAVGNPHSEISARPNYLLDEDVVLVSVYFRLGPFGFLSTGTQDAAGNYAYLDQVMALKWVQEHIERFGGDPNKVTILGFSSGSMAVTMHLASPLSAGLFHGAIAVSGSATSHYEVNNLYWTRRLARELECPKWGAQYLLNCLREVSWQRIVEVCARWKNYGISGMRWNYEVDGVFLVENPTEMIRKNRFNRVPVMTGVSSNEFDYQAQVMQNNSDLLDDIDLNFGHYAIDFLEFESSGNDDERVKGLRQFYFNTTSINRYSLDSFGRMQSDLIGYGIHRLANLLKDYTNVYYYRFDYVGENSIYPDSTGKAQGVAHGDDLNYVLPRFRLQVDSNSTDNFMVDRMTKLYASFAANGAPSPIENITWPPFTTHDPVVLYMDRYPRTGDPFFVDRYALWDKLFPLKESNAQMLFPAVGLLFLNAVLIMNIYI